MWPGLAGCGDAAKNSPSRAGSYSRDKALSVLMGEDIRFQILLSDTKMSFYVFFTEPSREGDSLGKHGALQRCLGSCVSSRWLSPAPMLTAGKNESAKRESAVFFSLFLLWQNIHNTKLTVLTLFQYRISWH